MRRINLISALFLLSFTGCVTLFNDYQSAKILPKNTFEITPNFSASTFYNDGSESAQKNLGVHAGYGISERVEFRLLAHTMKPNNGSWFEYFALGAGPKFSLLKDHLALYVPLGVGFGSDLTASKHIETHPTILFSLYPDERLEFNTNVKGIIPFNSNQDVLVAFNIGLGVIASDKLTIRPSYGMLFNPGEEGHYGDIGIGVSYRF